MAADTKTPITTELNLNFSLRKRQIYGAGSHTWTKPEGLKAVIVEVQAGGGGAGGTEATGTSQGAISSGGTGGAYCKKLILEENLSPTESVTVGAGGAGGATGGNPGVAGGNSSFGSHCSATGGLGGTFSSATTGTRSLESDVAPNATGGDINISGGITTGAFWNGNGDIAFASKGGDSVLGIGGRGRVQNGTGPASEVGGNGEGYGGGGGGSISLDSSAAVGGNGSDGIVIVWEYY